MMDGEVGGRTAAAVAVEGLSFSYEKGRPVLQDLSFIARQGEILVIAGLSGCGKTTLCHILTGIIPHCIKGELAGRVSLLGQSIEGKTPAKLASQIGLVFQDADLQLVCTALEDEIAFGPENLCRAPEEMRRQVDDMLARLGFEGLAERNPDTLSGGQKKLLTLGTVLVLEPEILIFDEPMSNLDARGRELMKSAILSLRDQGRTVLMVEHDLTLADYADRWLLLEAGRLAALDTPENLLTEGALLRRLQLWFD